jgi:hypothetical protein
MVATARQHHLACLLALSHRARNIPSMVGSGSRCSAGPFVSVRGDPHSVDGELRSKQVVLAYERRMAWASWRWVEGELKVSRGESKKGGRWAKGCERGVNGV